MWQVVRPTLDPSMKLQLQQAFDLIDQDGSGAIDVDELEEAFKVGSSGQPDPPASVLAVRVPGAGA